jgi:hypothetical protein
MTVMVLRIFKGSESGKVREQKRIPNEATLACVIEVTGFRFLHFGYSERTAAKKGAYQMSFSALQGRTCGLESGDIMSCATCTSTHPLSYFRSVYNLMARAGRPSSLLAVATQCTTLLFKSLL